MYKQINNYLKNLIKPYSLCLFNPYDSSSIEVKSFPEITVISLLLINVFKVLKMVEMLITELLFNSKIFMEINI